MCIARTTVLKEERYFSFAVDTSFDKGLNMEGVHARKEFSTHVRIRTVIPLIAATNMNAE